MPKKSLLIFKLGAIGMTPQLRALALAEDHSLVPSSHTVVYNSSFRASDVFLLLLWTTGMHVMNKRAYKVHISIRQIE